MCGEVKLRAEFYTAIVNNKPYPTARCRPCNLEYNRTRRAANPTEARDYIKAQRAKKPEQYAAYSRKHLLKKNFGLTTEAYDLMLDAQSGVCAICKSECTKGYRLAVDHDHKTGRIRALLCSGCNLGIGNFRESPDVLAAAVEYLQQHAPA